MPPFLEILRPFMVLLKEQIWRLDFCRGLHVTSSDCIRGKTDGLLQLQTFQGKHCQEYFPIKHLHSMQMCTDCFFFLDRAKERPLWLHFTNMSPVLQQMSSENKRASKWLWKQHFLLNTGWIKLVQFTVIQSVPGLPDLDVLAPQLLDMQSGVFLSPNVLESCSVCTLFLTTFIKTR